MPYSQQQYQIRCSLAEPGQATADLVVWADAFGHSPVPSFANRVVSLRNRNALARWVLAEQERRGERTSVLIVVAGATEPGELPVANLVTAGAFISALSELGLDHTSPEAATVLAAFEGVRPARKHLLGASGQARQLRAAGHADAVNAALELDADDTIIN